MNEKVQYWLDVAIYDLDTAKAMLDTKRYLYVGFMCHQAIEKALKAIISNNSEAIPPKTHDLIKLAKSSGIYTNMSDEQIDFLYLLLPLNIESRYPSYKEELLAELSEDRCKSIIIETEALLIWIKQQL